MLPSPTREVAVLSMLLSCSLVMAQEAPPQALFVGNSYTYSNELPRRVSEALQETVPGLDGVGAAHLTGGGLRLPDHVARVDAADARWVEALTGEPGRWTWTILQDQSQIPGFPETEAIWQASAAAVTVLDGYAAAQETETVLFMTWGRRDGDPANLDLYPDFETMNARLDAGYQAYATRGSEAERTLWIAPVGRAFGSVYDRIESAGDSPELTDSDFHRLYVGDGSHPSPLGTALAAGVFVRTLTGWTPAWREPPVGVDAGDVDWLLEAVDAAVVPFRDLPYPWAVRRDSYVEPVDVDEDLGWVVSGRTFCATVGVDGALDADARVTLGAMHDGVAGCGRLWVLDDGRMDVAAIEVEADAVGDVVVEGGHLTVGSVQAPVMVSGGALSLTGMAAAPITMAAGSLVLAAGSSGTSLETSGGTITLPAGTPDTASVSFSESASFAGRLTVTGLSTAPAALVAAASIQLDGGLVHDLPADWSLEVREVDGIQVLQAAMAGGTDEEGTEPGGEGSSGEGTTASGARTGDDGDAAAGTDQERSTDKGVGCAVAGCGVGGLGVVLGALVARRRRWRRAGSPQVPTGTSGGMGNGRPRR